VAPVSGCESGNKKSAATQVVAEGCAMSFPPVDGGGPERRLPDRLKLLAHLAQEIPHFSAFLDSFASIAPMLHRVLVAARSA
jgi:hypothetical protein